MSIFLKDLRNSNSHIEISGLDIIENINKENKKVFISGHFANFELMSMELTKRNVSLATIYRPLNNFFLNPFMEYLRRKYICKNQIKRVYFKRCIELFIGRAFNCNDGRPEIE